MKAKNLGIFSAILASVCCLGPLILVLVGLGSLGIGVAIGRYHWWFLGVGVLLIIITWRFYFKEKKSCDLKACQMENKKATLIILIAATLVVAFFVGLNFYTYIGKSSSITPSFSKENLESVVIPVEGMTCFTCEVAVSSALKKIDGVISSKASAKEGIVKINYDPSRTNMNQLVAIINKTGYKAKLSGDK